jgi:spermidine synthase
MDVVIVDSTDPIGPAEGLFTRAFYQDCFKALRPGGILIQQSESPLYHMNLIQRMHQEMQAAGFHHTHTGPFPQPCYPSGWWSATMAGKEIALNQFRTRAAEEKKFQTKYYNAKIHQACLALPEFMKILKEST